MENLFSFTETPDQRRAIDEVKADMEAPRPRDRLVCADGGNPDPTSTGGKDPATVPQLVRLAEAISLPIFTSGALQSNLAATRARYDMAVESYNQTVLDALRDAADTQSR